MHKLISRLRGFITSHPSIEQVAWNSGWLLGDRIVRMVVGVLIGVWTARYLGPENYGLLSYSVAFIALFVSFSTLGLASVVVRNLVRDQDAGAMVLGSAFALQSLGGLVASGTAICFALTVHSYQEPAAGIVIILSLSMLFKGADVVKYWFESKVASRPVVWTENAVLMCFAGIRVLLILLAAPVQAFAWLIVLESMAFFVALLALYHQQVGTLLAWRVRMAYATALLRDSWPLLLSGSFVLMVMNVDKVMIGSLLDAHDVGLYSSASVLVETSYIMAVVIGASIAPMLTRLHLVDRMTFDLLSQNTFCFLTGLALTICLVTTLLAQPLLETIFGRAFSEAGLVLAVGIWSSLFVYHVSLRTRILVIEGRQFVEVIFAGMTLMTNVVANWIMIPRFGVVGAAYASVLSWSLSVLIFPLAFRHTRQFPRMFLGVDVMRRTLKTNG